MGDAFALIQLISKEKDSSLLEEPMVKEAIALFNPKRVRIKRKS